jgi:hypothetical protein
MRLSLWRDVFPPILRRDQSNPFCNVSNIRVRVDVVFLLNTGGTTGITQQRADGYEWTLPAGWKYNGSATSPVTTVEEFIDVTPDDGCKGGNISVKAYVSCTSGKKYSSSTSLSLNRQIGTFLGVPSGYTGPKCANVAPVLFTATPLTCANNYRWTATGTQWKDSQGSLGPWNTATNTIALTPMGNSTDQGVIAVDITLSCGSVITQTYSAVYTDPAPPTPFIQKSSSNNEICAGETWTFTCTPQGGFPSNYGFDWVASNGLLVNGSPATTNSPVHTTTNTVTVSATSSSFGPVAVGVRLNNTQCTPSAYSSLSTQAGPYSNSQFSISGPSVTCPNTTPSFLSTLIDPSITNYQWGWSGFSSASGQGTPYLTAYAGPGFTFGTLTLRLGNRCGLTGTPAIKNVSKPYCSGGYGFALSPNPTGDVLSISTVDELSQIAITEQELPEKIDETTVTVVNSKSRVVASGNLKKGTLNLDVSNLPNGLYIVRINEQGKLTTKQVIIKH